MLLLINGKIAGADNVGLFGGASDKAWDAWTGDDLFKPFAHNVGKVMEFTSSNYEDD
jgi:sarcosine oxidase/sarcosine oxidase/L-pipecolate oxidase